jgi:hypothetical protein
MRRVRIFVVAILAVVSIGFVLACVLLFPKWLYPLPSLSDLHQANLTGKERLDVITERLQVQNSARATLLQGLGGVAVLLGADFTFGQLTVSRKQLQRTAEEHQEQFNLAERGQITERFTRAVDQLGGGSEDVRLGGVYALQQISRDASLESSAIHEILAAYIRIHSPWHREHDRGPVRVEAIPRLRDSAPAVQAAMLVLGRRKWEAPDLPLGLMGTDLRRLRLSDIDIPGGANLAHVLLWRSSLINASLKRANFCEAKLGGTDLRHAGLKEADLRRADLRSADLRKVSVDGADFSDADLCGADFRGVADLGKANLSGAKASGETRWPMAFDWQGAGVVLEVASADNIPVLTCWRGLLRSLVRH